ncbi:SpaH/EbpB family LPXTG-anchored major pilin [uncultured Enorma sp.]|uniref:SpaH/EbpB family LPXTG-anchored major pilin n=1 Tax=uncultured Enorma sp. TaxID=1714346 RepID=UPI0026DCB559|nr:SpaH/EbpB family LPXTG-anchored major pilin [uncultured Enorma sp.]
MAHSITNKLRGTLAAFIALVAALLLVPGTAFADPAVMGNGILKVAGLHDGDNVEIYKIVDIKVDGESNQLEYSWANGYDDTTFGITLEEYLNGVENSDSAEKNADVIAAYLAAREIEPTASGKVDSRDEMGNWRYTFRDLTSGQYLIKVNNENDATRVYQTTIGSVAPKAVDGEWVMETVENYTQVNLKSDSLNPAKNIAGKDSVDNLSIGDRVLFTLYVTIPEYTDTTDRTFVVSDEMDPTFQFDGLRGNGVNINRDYYTFEQVDNQHFSVAINEEGLKEHAGERLRIEYYAVVTSDASYDTALANTMSVTFSTDSVSDNIETAEDTVYATVYAAQFQKNAADTNKGLPGAVFEVYKKGDTPGEDAPVLTAESDENGLLSFDGLGAGEYILHEKSAPAGYKLAADMEFTIESDVQEDYSGTVQDFTGTAIVDEVVNPAEELPTTGGAGTVAFTAAGVVIMAGAAAFIIRSRKNNN